MWLVGCPVCVEFELVTDCSSFVGEKSGKVVSCYRSGGRWWRGQRRELNVLKRSRMSGAC